MGLFDFFRKKKSTAQLPANLTQDTFGSAKQDAYLVCFSADLSGPNRFMKLLQKAGIKFSYVDVYDERNQTLSDKYHIRALPTTMLLNKNGEIIDSIIGGLTRTTAQFLIKLKPSSTHPNTTSSHFLVSHSNPNLQFLIRQNHSE